MELIGLIPAAGVASRLGSIPCSKEVFPIPDMDAKNGISVVSEQLLNSFREGGVKKVFFIIRQGKWDIPAYFGTGKRFGVDIGYVVVDQTPGTPFTLNYGFPFVNNAVTALGFPDIVLKPTNTYAALANKMAESDADIVLGIFPVETYLKWDMIDFNADRSIRDIVIKQNRPDLKFGWSNAIWKPSFTEFMNKCLASIQPGAASGEIYVGTVFQEAIRNGLKIDYVKFEEGSSIDIGTPEDLMRYMSLKQNR